MSTTATLDRESPAFAFGDIYLSDVDLVFVQEQQPQQQEKKQQSETESSRAAKRLRNGRGMYKY